MTIALSFEGRVVLVCGAARGGISGATCRQLAAAGATVVMVDHVQSLIDETVGEIQAAGGNAAGFLVDLLDPAQTDTLIPNIVQRFGRLDGVANVAGGTRAEEWMALESTPTNVFRDTLNLNFEYVFRICRDAAKSWIEREAAGAIVNVTSISALTSAPFHGPYGAAKAAIATLTRTMAFEWGRYGIRANSVAPGAVPSDRVMKRPRTEGANAAPGSDEVVFTSTEELAHVIVFLLSDLASGVSGQNIVVDSGMSTKYCAGARPFKIVKRNPQATAPR